MRPVRISFLMSTLFMLSLSSAVSPHAHAEPAKFRISASLSHSAEGEAISECFQAPRIFLMYSPVEKLVKEPDYNSSDPQYGTIKIGNGTDNIITIVVDALENKEPTIYIDQNNDEDLTNDKVPEWTKRREDLAQSSAIVQVNYSTPEGEKTYPYRLSLFRALNTPQNIVYYCRDEYRRGEISINGKTYKLAVFDDNGDGLFDDLTNTSFYIDLTGDGNIGSDHDFYEFYKGDGVFTIDNTTYRVAGINPMGTEISIEVSEKKALDFTATDLDGNRISLSDYRGKVVLLDFWATWCIGCLQELPNVKDVYAKFKDKGFVIIGINLDINRRNLEGFLKKADIAWPQIHDGAGGKSDIADLYNVSLLPSTFLLDKNGIIRNKNLRGPALESAIAALIEGSDKKTSKQNDSAKIGADKAE